MEGTIDHLLRCIRNNELALSKQAHELMKVFDLVDMSDHERVDHCVANCFEIA